MPRVAWAKAGGGQAFAALLCLSLAGCSSWSRETRIEEATYQVLSAVDTAQTYHGAKDPACYTESDPITSMVIGNHPKPATVIGYGVARAGLHAFVTDWMVRDDAAPWAIRTWELLSIGVEGKDVHGNWVIGLRVGSAHAPSYAPCMRR